MALFTDGPIASLTDLRAYEGSILDLANTESIDLTAKLAIAQRELALEVTSFLLRRRSNVNSSRDLQQVVVTEPLLHAHIMSTLALTFRDACNSQLNDRYQAKWKQYSELAQRSIRQLMDIGVGICRSPLPRSPLPVAGTTLGGLLPGTAYYVRTAVAGMSGSTGEWSDPVIVQAVPGLLLTVQGQDVPADAAGWVIYAGESEQSVTRQNESPVPGGALWVQASAGLRNDLPPLPIQKPDFYIANRQEILRG